MSTKIPEPDWLAIARYKYLTDPEFHGMVEVIFQERIDKELTDRYAALATDRYDALVAENDRLRTELERVAAAAPTMTNLRDAQLAARSALLPQDGDG